MQLYLVALKFFMNANRKQISNKIVIISQLWDFSISKMLWEMTKGHNNGKAWSLNEEISKG